MNSYHDSTIHPKWVEKTSEEVGDLAGDPLDSRKTRSQFHNAYSTCELNISDGFFIMVGYNPQTYLDHHLTQHGKQPCKKSSTHCKKMRFGNWLPCPPRGN